ncbi:MAG: aminopeptidase P family protein [Candidatus Bathyarchaeota archaeon]|nr:MAG: aminopeptidase P family protein [Candidatus Bathyarchaeota archaeon]
MPKLRISWKEYGRRLEATKAFLTEKEMDAMLVTGGVNIFYLSNFYHMTTERPAALVVPLEGEMAFMGPLLEVDHLKHQTQLVPNVYTYLDYPGETHPIDLFAGWLKEMGLGKAKIVADNPAGAAGGMGYEGPPLSEKMPDATFEKLGRFFWDMRLKKTEEELALMRESAKWGNLAHRYLQEYTSPGLWDAEVSLMASAEATSIMKRTLGPEFKTVKGSRAASAGFRGQVGWKSAMPHCVSVTKMLEVGDVLVTGAGADVGGYGSELERTMIIGEPTEKQRKYFDVMVRSQDASIEALKPGNTCADVDKASRKVIIDAGYESLLRHHTGHGIGLQGHEPPFLDIGNPQVLEPGMVVSIEPGIYELGYAGFRHSDTAVITEDSHELITFYPRDIDSMTIL